MDDEIINSAWCVFILRRRRLRRLWMQLRWKLPCRCARRTATRYPLPGMLGPSSRTSPLTPPSYPRGSPILFREAWRGKRKCWKFTAAPRRSSLLCAALEITAWRHSRRDSVAFLPPPRPRAPRRLGRTATSEQLRCPRPGQTWGILCIRKAKCRWTSVQSVEAKSGRS